VSAATPGALLDRLRPKSCPVDERWSLSIGDVVVRRAHAASTARRADRIKSAIAKLTS